MITERLFFLFFISFLAQAQHNLRLRVVDRYDDGDSTVYIHCHGLGGNQNQAFHYCKYNQRKSENEWIVKEPLITFDFQDVKHNGLDYERGYNKHEVTLAQQNDIDCLSTAYNTAEEKFPNYNVVGHGISRGGAVWLNFCALYKPKNLRALVIESPFHDPVSVVKNYIWYVPGSDYIAKNLGAKFLNLLFPLWDQNGIKPVDIVDQIPTEISLLFVHSEQDSLIHHESSRILCQKLADSGHDVYCLFLPYGGEHSTLIYGKECHVYNNVAQAFYKKCDLPHELECALDGEMMLEQSKVTKQESAL